MESDNTHTTTTCRSSSLAACPAVVWHFQNCSGESHQTNVCPFNKTGTTLLRVLLDAHPDIRCGEETRVIPRLLSYRMSWMKAPFESKRLEEAGITAQVLDSAIGSFILEIIVRHGKPAPRLCNKDPFTLRSAVYLQYLFPNAKFIFMIRDGRAVVHSIISRQVTISGFDLSNYRQCLKKWNSAMSSMVSYF